MTAKTAADPAGGTPGGSPRVAATEPVRPELVSVVVPNYNGAKTLPLCLTAIAAQTYRPIEVIVVDDASTDDSVAIAGRFDCTVIALEHNAGPAAARNRGIAASRGGVVFFVDVDVALDPDAVATAVRLLRENPAYAGVSGLYHSRPLIDDGLVERCQVLHAHYWRTRHEGPVRTGYFSLGGLRREVIDEVGGFDENLRANNNEDTEYGFRVGERYPMLLTSQVMGWHDDDDTLLPILRKHYLRVSSLVPLLIERRGQRPGGQAAHRPAEVVTAGLAAVTAPLGLFEPALLGLPLLFLLGFVLTEPGLVRFVRRAAGARYVLPVLALHYVSSLTIAVAAGVGLLRWLVQPRFRALYRGQPAWRTAPTVTSCGSRQSSG